MSVASIDEAAAIVARFGGPDYKWTRLAELAGLTLPAWTVEATAEAIWVWVQRLNISEEAYLEWVGWESPNQQIEANPMRPLRCYVGEMIEHFDSDPVAEDQIDVWRARELADDGEAALPPAVAGLRTTFADAGWWQHLAEWAGIELPAWEEPITADRMAEVLHSLKVSVRSYQNLVGDAEIIYFKWYNPRWGLRPWVGLVLEDVYDGRLQWRTKKSV